MPENETLQKLDQVAYGSLGSLYITLERRKSFLKQFELSLERLNPNDEQSWITMAYFFSLGEKLDWEKAKKKWLKK